MIAWLPRWVAHVRATIHAKLLTGFLFITLLLVGASGIGLYALMQMHERGEHTVHLQRKIAAYRQLNHDTVAQLYNAASALLEPEARRLDATLRQLKQFGYDLDRLQFVAQDEREVMANVRADFERFIDVVTRAVRLLQDGKQTEGRRLLSVAAPLADRLERRTNELVNKAEADLVSGTDIANRAYLRSRNTVIGCALVSLVLALVLGYTISWSLIAPIRKMEARMSEIAAGDFSSQVIIPNRDELGTLAHDLNRMSDELGRLYAQVDAAREDAERANAAKSRFLAAASHDLRQPMHALNLWVSNLQLALTRGNRNAAETARETIEHSCRSLSASFNAILDLSMLDTGRIEVKLDEIDLSGTLRQIHAEFEPLARQKGLDLRLRLSRSTPLSIRSDPVLLGRVLRNLVSNAIKYTQHGGVVIGEVSHADAAEVRIADTGIGIPDDHRDNIFDEFFQVANRERDPAHGLGLGLAIVRRCIAALPAHALRFTSRVGRGSHFRVRAPRIVLEAMRLHRPQSGDSRSIDGAFVAIVDDDPVALGGLGRILQDWGCFVVAGRDGDALLEALREHERIPDLLVTDLRLATDETGLDVANRLHQASSMAVPVIVITGDPVAELVLASSHAPLRMLHKPVVTKDLRQALEAMLPERRYV